MLCDCYWLEMAMLNFLTQTLMQMLFSQSVKCLNNAEGHTSNTDVLVPCLHWNNCNKHTKYVTYIEDYILLGIAG